MKPRPRLSVALRTLSTISNPYEPDENAITDLKEKRKHNAERLARESLYTWEEFKAIVRDAVGFANVQEVENHMKSLRNITKEIVGTEFSTELLDAACVHIFKLFHSAEMVTNKHQQDLRRCYGVTEFSLANSACNAVKSIANFISEDAVRVLLTEKGSTNGLHKPFGADIKFKPVTFMNLNEIIDDSEIEWMEEMPEKIDFNFFSRNAFEAREANSKEAVTTRVPETKYNKTWLRATMVQYFGDDYPTMDTLVETALTLLLSNKKDVELQNELFDLLGFDRFSLIEMLLENRHQITSACTVQALWPVSEQCRKGSELPSKYSRTFTIQLEEEKTTMKFLRKEEKKLQRLMSKVTNEDETEVLDLDPQFLKAQREGFFMASMNAPLFSKKSAPVQEKYPHVFDSYVEAKKSAAFVSGTKMSLPIGFERINNKQYEEIIIPPNDPPPANVGKKLKLITELDEWGQSAFEGMKSLNRIQSIVFDTAYHTNENMLICAPTGAGKTNIAMLTIVREIKQHIENNVINKNSFKIVYIAPMKALAAEMTANFSKRLKSLGIIVKEYTGDMQLTKTEISQTQIIVTTPEKWDVVTRKGIGDVSLTQIVSLLIFDEVHLLHGNRGPVVEALVARTLRQVESTQRMIRIVGLSATLPNYIDVATFLRVNPYVGLYFFDSRFRPVPLGQTFIGVKAINPLQQLNDMDAVCYDKCLEMVKKGHQVMVFVHTRNSTMKTAIALRELANNKGDAAYFQVDNNAEYGAAEKMIMKSRNQQLREIFSAGFSTHHAGMLRQDRSLVEKLFRDGMIKVLVCTATLAWGVNLPAHAVVIKGTEIYDAQHGSFVDLGILDVLQIFGRAGRPQYDTSGHGIIITSHDKLNHYLSLLTCQYPIESQFTQNLTDNLNAEIVLGTVTNVEEAIKWLSYTYMFVRMRKNPQVYGIKYQTLKDDPLLLEHRKELIIATAKQLDRVNMVRFHDSAGFLHPTDLGRTASHFYIKYNTMETIKEKMIDVMDEGLVLALVSMAEEFEQLKVREDEMDELDTHIGHSCRLPVFGGKENTHGKVNILIQAHVSRERFNSFSLISDQFYVTQNATRIMRALFEIALRRRWSLMAGRLLNMSKVLEHRLWDFESPLRQFSWISPEALYKIEAKNLTILKLKEMDKKEIGNVLHHPKMGTIVKQCVGALPSIELDAVVQPITRGILRVRVHITPDFTWDDRLHGNVAESFWLWVEDPESNYMHHSEYFLLTKKQVVKKELQALVFTIPLSEPIPNQYYIRVISDRWLGSEFLCALSFQHLILPQQHPPHTELLNLDPLPITAIKNPQFEALYNFTHFNPIQTQVFHTLYHTDSNVLIGAPTGSGKTIAAEIAMFRVFKEYPQTKVVYIAPLKALVRERVNDWKERFERRLSKKIVELTGDVLPDANAIASSDVIIATPEKWDGVSRSWQTRNYVRSVSLIVIDEIHLLGEDRGPVLEVIVSRTNFITSHTDFPLRIIGLSTALANARDLADWLGIQEAGLFNFRPSVRPVPLEVHIEGFPGKHYCPRMAMMNKPTFQAIVTHSPTKPTLVFVSSRRQTRLTALDLIAYLAAEDNPKQWLHLHENEMDNIIAGIKESNLKLTLAFGIGIHHAGLQEKDRRMVEELFVNQKIQVLIATATLAWGVNFPAHLVVVKGTEYYDGKTRRYVDFPITDVLQMMGRAGRPQYDDQGVAVVLVHDAKKNFYKKFLYSPFPVESSLLDVLPDHLNAEIVAGTITSKQECLDYLTWTYFFRRLIQNPSYYLLEDIEPHSLTKYLSGLVEGAMKTLAQSSCVELGDDNRTICSSTLGRIASYYYLHHTSVRIFHEKITADLSHEQLLEVLCSVHEYDELPVRHNEDAINSELAKGCPLQVNPHTYDSPHTKASLLFQAHFSRLKLPCADYQTDLKSVLDQAIRILQAMLDVAADEGFLATAIRVTGLIQMVLQARWYKECSLLILPGIESEHLHLFRDSGKRGNISKPRPITTLPELMYFVSRTGFETLARMLRQEFDESRIENIFQTLSTLPWLEVRVGVKGWWESSPQKEEYPVSIKGGKVENCVSLHADQEYILNVVLNRYSKLKKQNSHAYAPRFPKPKDEGWFVILGDVKKNELLGLKRVNYVQKRNVCQLMFYTPETTGRVTYTLYVLSDSYLGLDQQYDIHFDIIPMSLEAQVNTEVILDEDNLSS